MPVAFDFYFFPFAGGNVYSLRPLEKQFPARVNVIPFEPPARGKRIREPRAATIVELAESFAAAIQGRGFKRPYALYGHSMGALMAFLVARILADREVPLPAHLFLSGKSPPHISSREAKWYALPLPQFTERLAALGGCPPAVVADPELMAYFAPIIQHDMKLVAEYEHCAYQPLAIPVTVMIGSRESTTAEQAGEWAQATSQGFRLEVFEGGHFFIFDHIQEVSRLMLTTLIPD